MYNTPNNSLSSPLCDKGDTITLTIDGSVLTVPAGTSVIDAARKAGIHIPSLCYLPKTSAIGSCRVCAVEVEGQDALVTACNTKVQPDMVIRTSTARVEAHRKTALQLILAKHGLNSTNFCFSCAQNGSCELQDICHTCGVTDTPFPRVSPDERQPVKDSNPFLAFDPNLCISCQRCVASCNTRAVNGSLHSAKTGLRLTIDAPFGKDWNTTACESCGNCAEACPTGAITKKRQQTYHAATIKRTRTTCPYCGVGCQFDLLTCEGTVVDTQVAHGASNDGLLCVKGRSGSFDFITAPGRLTSPLIKNHKTGAFEKSTWDEALDLIASKFGQIKDKYGAHALAGFACSRSTNEDIYLFQKMVRCAFGTNNVDNCARVCHAPTVSGLVKTLGSGAMTNTIQDITRNPDLIVLVGSNPEEAHPVLGMQIRQAVSQGTKLIIIDPRTIGVSQYADIHLRIKPGTNVALANGIVHVLIKSGLADMEFIRERTENFEELAAMVERYTPAEVARICEIDERDLIAAAQMYGQANTAPIIYCLGVTEHTTGTDGVMSLSNMAMVAGKLGKPGCGVNPIRGQNNVQGACDMGATPADLTGYQKVADPEARTRFEAAWNCVLPQDEGLRATEVFPAIKTGEIRGLMIFGEDPVRTDPDTAHVIDALKHLDFLVIDDLFLTETAQFADVILPGRSYAEKEGTFTNTERRIQRVRKAIEGPDGPQLDTWIFTHLMNRMGYKQPELTSAELMDEIASLTPSYAGVSHRRLDSPECEGTGLQWPCPTASHPGTPILHRDGCTRGRGLFVATEYKPSAEVADTNYPFTLMTGRILYHYNACSMSGNAEGLNIIENSSFVEINQTDARRLKIADGDRVQVSSRRGVIKTTARVGTRTRPGDIWMPFHFQDGNANWLTNASFDKVCKVPEYKVCAVSVTPLYEDNDSE